MAINKNFMWLLLVIAIWKINHANAYNRSISGSSLFHSRTCVLKSHSSLKYYCRSKNEMKFRPCNKFELPGTHVKAECQPYYYSDVPLGHMRCNKAGRWINNLQHCVPECGVIKIHNELIANGTEASYGEVPWAVSIYRNISNKWTFICSGTLVASSIVISAGHCAWDEEAMKLYPATEFLIAAGKRHRDLESPLDYPQLSKVARIDVPKRFQGHATNLQDDISGFDLVTPVHFGMDVRPACLNLDESFEFRLVRLGIGQIAGFGLKDESGTPSEKLRVAQMPYIPIEDCINNAPPTFLSSITSDKMCAGYLNGGTAVCSGDSGAGLTFSIEQDGIERHFLIGVASGAPPADNARCNVHTFFTCTRVTEFKAFIESIWPN